MGPLKGNAAVTRRTISERPRLINRHALTSRDGLFKRFFCFEISRGIHCVILSFFVRSLSICLMQAACRLRVKRPSVTRAIVPCGERQHALRIRFTGALHVRKHAP